MPEAPFLPQSPLHRPIAQLALGLAATLEPQAPQAPRGGALDAWESLLLAQGRPFLRDALPATLQQQTPAAEKKGPARTWTCGHTCRTKGVGSREFLTAIGPIHLARTYVSRPACRLGGYPVEERLGFAGRLSTRAAQMITLAGVSQSFSHGGSRLKGRTGWTTCQEIIRPACHRQADQLEGQREAASPEGAPFQEANGQMEFQTAATKLNPLDGWRDMKIGVFAKREAGSPAPAEPWDTREVPAPPVRFAFAALEEIEPFAPRWGPWAEGVGLGEQELTVRGDGAGWIWEHAEIPFATWRGTGGLFHAGEWLAKAAKAGCGEGPLEAAGWGKESRLALLQEGSAGLCEYVRQSAEWVPDRARLEEAVPAVLTYRCGHQERVTDAGRVRRRQAIGSGRIEGACQQLIGGRMKQTGAEWDVANANRMALLCALAYADALPLYFIAA